MAVREFYNTFRLQNEEIRPSDSPQDALVCMRDDGTVSVPFQVGTTVGVIPIEYLSVTADADGLPVVDLSALATVSGDAYLIIAKAITLQIPL